MICNVLTKPIVFAGPSLDLCDNLSQFEIKPPIKRGDLDLLITHSKPRTLVILDGVFGSNLAISPTECRQAIEMGHTLIGGSSMGALRASELWSVGMMGFGDVYNLFRIGKLKSDADVAVSYNKKLNQELTLSIVHVRHILNILCQQQALSVAFARTLLLTARKIHWSERFPELLLDAWKESGLESGLLNKLTTMFSDISFNPKKRDASYIISLFTSGLWPQQHHMKGEAHA